MDDDNDDSVDNEFRKLPCKRDRLARRPRRRWANANNNTRSWSDGNASGVQNVACTQMALQQVYELRICQGGCCCSWRSTAIDGRGDGDKPARERGRMG